MFPRNEHVRAARGGRELRLEVGEHPELGVVRVGEVHVGLVVAPPAKGLAARRPARRRRRSPPGLAAAPGARRGSRRPPGRRRGRRRRSRPRARSGRPSRPACARAPRTGCARSRVLSSPQRSATRACILEDSAPGRPVARHGARPGAIAFEPRWSTRRTAAACGPPGPTSTRSAITASSPTATRGPSSPPTGRSSGCACRDSTRRASSRPCSIAAPEAFGSGRSGCGLRSPAATSPARTSSRRAG